LPLFRYASATWSDRVDDVDEPGGQHMRIGSVMEARDEYLSFEMERAARKLAEEVLEIKPGQTVAITADTNADARVVWASARAIYAAGGVPSVLWYHTQPRPQMEPPAPIAAAVAAADIWIEHAVAYTMYTHAWQKALDAGVLYCELGGMDVDGMVRCIGRQNITLMAEMGEVVIDLLTDAEMEVTSELGSAVTFHNRGVRIGEFKMKATPEKTPIMLAGQVSWSPDEASLQGRVIADGILYPPTEIGIMSETVAFELSAGRITSIEGAKEARLLRNWIGQLDDPTMYRIAHISMGFNPGIPVPTGRVVEDERAFGDIDFGFGAWVGRPAAGHFDFTCRQVTIKANGVPVQENGRFTHPRLAPLCRAMGVPNH
jgi:leucyl aminopeptidase (aminopeptidase T)